VGLLDLVFQMRWGDPAFLCNKNNNKLFRLFVNVLRWGIFMLENYFPILLFLFVGLLVGVAPLVMGYGIGKVMGTVRPDTAKNSPYECGFEAFEDARMQFDVRYYLVAILFILFDLEVAFLVPWAVVLKELGMFGFLSMMIFLTILVVGFIYEWKKGALEWE
jgi:NADH-quinone oxidoreductase subunit A